MIPLLCRSCAGTALAGRPAYAAVAEHCCSAGRGRRSHRFLARRRGPNL